MTTKELIKAIVTVLDNKKAIDIKVIGIRDLTIIADYFVLCSGGSTTQVKALADEVEFKLKEQGITPQKVEGYRSRNWILLDYGSVIVHIFVGETRNFYDLEHLWTDGEEVDISEFIGVQE